MGAYEKIIDGIIQKKTTKALNFAPKGIYKLLKR